MRVAQVAPLYESVPPKLYGGTELVVFHLTEELMRLGHDVTLFASGDSETRARLVPGSKESLRLSADSIDPFARHLAMIEDVYDRKSEFDLIHFHIDYLHFPVSRREQMANVTTLHGRLDIPDLKPMFAHFPDMPVISISDAQRRPLPNANWVGTVHHGFPLNEYSVRSGQGKYLAFLGRTSPEKGLDHAIRIANEAGVPLKIAAKVDSADQEYFDSVIKPLLNTPDVEFLGEIGYPEKGDFLGNALALIFPIDWPEPFGLVMIEALACGTPVVAYPFGSVPEIVQDGVNGFLVSDIPSAVRAVKSLSMISRQKCRQTFEQNFSVQRMAEDYLRIYEKIIGIDPLTSVVADGVCVG